MLVLLFYLTQVIWIFCSLGGMLDVIFPSGTVWIVFEPSLPPIAMYNYDGSYRKELPYADSSCQESNLIRRSP